MSSTDPNPELATRLEQAREAAWESLPFYRTWLAGIVWKRICLTPAWNLKPKNEKGSSRPPYDIVGGMFIYSINEEIVVNAPSDVLKAIYGVLFSHTSRFWCRSKKIILVNGNGNIHNSPEWNTSLALARRLGFQIDQMQSWIAEHTDTKPS